MADAAPPQAASAERMSSAPKDQQDSRQMATQTAGQRPAWTVGPQRFLACWRTSPCKTNLTPRPSEVMSGVCLHRRPSMLKKCCFHSSEGGPPCSIEGRVCKQAWCQISFAGSGSQFAASRRRPQTEESDLVLCSKLVAWQCIAFFGLLSGCLAT